MIEKERETLNRLVEEKGRTEETYRQSRMLDELIVRYMASDMGIVPTPEPALNVGITPTPGR